MSLPITKNPHTTLAGAGALVGAILVFVVCKYFNLPDGATTTISTLVGGLFVSLGLITAGDASTNEANASAIAAQVNTAIAVVKADMDAKHAANAAAIAVHEAQLAVVIPAVVAAVTPAITVTTPAAGHVVTNDS